MTNRPLEPLKETANQLAHFITHKSKDTKQINALKQKLGLTGPGSNEENFLKKDLYRKDRKDQEGQEDRVGIWTAAFNNGKKYYTRDLKYKKEFEQWARVHDIPPKNSKKRIIYLGESVSRGFLLDPFYTPASVLETLLNSEPGLLEIEVVDLARNDCNIDMLTELCSSCLALKPDALVIFAGNNWLDCVELTGGLLDEIINFMAGERFAGLRPILERQYKEKVAAFMKHVGNVSSTHRVPVVYVVPEFNLMDFRSNWVQRINLWPKGETGKWLNLKEKIEEAFKKGDIERAEVLIPEMIKLNEGNPYGFELLARCRLERNLFAEAGECLRWALDTAMFRIQNVPCCTSVIRNTLLDEAAKYNIPVVDLPEIFSRVQSGRPPGRQLFLDYCHLSVEGIRVTMASTAHRVFSLLTKKEIPVDVLKARAPKPNPEVTARSHFFAAIHNAHRGEQSYEILYYHCLQALNQSDTVKDLMLNYIQMATHHTVWSLSKWCEKLFESGEMNQFPYLLQPHHHYIMDVELVDAMAAALEEHGIDMKNRVLSLREKEHGFVKGKINLLESYYHLTSYVAAYHPRGSYYRAFAPISRFFLVTGKDNDVTLQLTYRVPDQNQKKEKVGVKLNDSMVVELPAFNRWQNFSMQVPKGWLKNGINIITFLWPPNVKYKKDAKKTQSPKTGMELINRMMYPSYGEIHMFKALREYLENTKTINWKLGTGMG